MNREIRISARAARQFQAADRWWRENRSAAPHAMREDFSAAAKLLAEQPGIGATYEGTRAQGVRRLYLSRVRYFIYYRFSDASLDVLALWHAQREREPEL